MNPSKYLDQLLNPIAGRHKKLFQANPTLAPLRQEPSESQIFLYEYDQGSFEAFSLSKPEDTFKYFKTESVSWINVEGLRKNDIESICNHFGIHPLITEDILHMGQRPKMDEMNGIVFCLLNMLYYDEKGIDSEQISIVLGKNYVITFQEDPSRDVFNTLRDKIKIAGSKVRMNGADFLFYSLIDAIVDNYFVVMERFGEKIELLEDEISRAPKKRTLARINILRKEVLVLRKNVSPVRELVNGVLKSESGLLEERTEKYFKDVFDHSIQASDMSENYRDLMMNLQDLYMNNVNFKTNEAMKVMAIVTCLMAPATVIGGIFGMNFDFIPFTHDRLGFYLPIFFMVSIPVIMLFVFKKRGWF